MCMQNAMKKCIFCKRSLSEREKNDGNEIIEVDEQSEIRIYLCVF